MHYHNFRTFSLAAIGLLTTFIGTQTVSADTPDIKPDTATAPYKAHSFYARGDLNGAMAVLQDAIREQPRDPQLHFMLGNTYFRMQQWDESAAEYRTAALLRPRHPDTYLGLGFSHYQAGRLIRATYAWETALRQTPEDAFMLLSYALGLNSQGKTSQAHEHVARAIEVDPDWHRRLSIDIRWTLEMIGEICALVEQIESIEQEVTEGPC